MKDSTCIRQVFNIHQSIGIAKYFVTILQNVLSDGAKVLKKMEKNGNNKRRAMDPSSSRK